MAGPSIQNIIAQAAEGQWKTLDLSESGITSLPSEICNLTHLTDLYLSCNDLTKLPESIGNLTNLTNLDLYKNNLVTLPESIGNLTNLTNLDLYKNNLVTLPESIGNLINLTDLDLYKNDLVTLPESIGNLINLINLELSSNQLTTLPESMSNLIHLTDLNLYGNNLTTLPDSIGNLINLSKFDLSVNDLTTLPESIGNLVNLTYFELNDNSFVDVIPEVVSKGGFAVRDYYRQRAEENTDYIYEAKLLILGDGGAGKTSLANKLINPEYKLNLESSENPEKSTEGIDVLHLDFPHASGNSFRINLWDFGGQEIYHATHQFFLTKRSLYLLVADTRQNNTDFNYWLEVVKILSDASPTLIIKNEKQERPCQIKNHQLYKRFSSQLKGILRTNLATNRGLPEILTAIQYHISQLPHVGTPLPKTWVRIREALEADQHNYITQTKFLDLCDDCGFKRRKDKLQLSGYLHDLGVCLHFQNDPVLKNWVILKPEWGTTAVYTVLDTPFVQQSLGYFTHDDLAKIWADEQYIDMYDELLQLMMCFKLCYEIPHRPRTYIVPQLLSPHQPDYAWDDVDNLILRYDYEFMPKGILTRFSIEMNKYIDSNLIWQDGVILIDKNEEEVNARAEIIENYYEKEISIRISGKLKKPLREKIRHEFDKIHTSYKKNDSPLESHYLSYQEYIPCNCSQCKGSQMPYSYALKRLEDRFRNNRKEIECDISYEKVSVRNLIDDAIGHRNIEQQPTTIRVSEELPRNQTFIINAGNRITNQPMSNTINQYGQGNNYAGDNVHGDKIGTQINNSQNLAQATRDIKALFAELDQTHDKTTPSGQMMIAAKTVEAIEGNPTVKKRLINALKEGSATALEEAIDHPAIKPVVAAIKGYIDA
ncbi:MAG: COR domain-containing protein [Phormidesmis sp.]